MQVEEERRKAKLLELTKKKEEYRKIQIAEFKKKKIEDDMKKNNLEEGENKRKLYMQKIFEEWEKNKISQKKREREEKEKEKEKQNLFMQTKMYKEKEQEPKKDENSIKNDSKIIDEKSEPISLRDLPKTNDNEKLGDLSLKNNVFSKTIEVASNSKFTGSGSGPGSKCFKNNTISPIFNKKYKNRMNMASIFKRRSLDTDAQGILNTKYDTSQTNINSPGFANTLAKPYIFLPRITHNNLVKTEVVIK